MRNGHCSMLPRRSSSASYLSLGNIPVLIDLFHSNMINASSDPAGAFADLINSHEFLELGADALISAAPRTDSYSCASPSLPLSLSLSSHLD